MTMASTEQSSSSRRICPKCGLSVSVARWNNSLIQHLCQHDNPCSIADPPCEKCKTDKAPPGKPAKPPSLDPWWESSTAVPQFGQAPPPRKTKAGSATEHAQTDEPAQRSLFDQPRDLPRNAPHVVGSATSRAAAESISGAVLNNMQLRVLQAIIDSDGLTCDEVEAQLDLRHQTASARIHELRKAGYLEEKGIQRSTRSGRNATVWKATNKAKGSI